MTTLPADYAERVYAGVLGKLIGVYLGRPFEGWTHERITAELGEIWYYVNERLNVPLIVTDDDLSGTFTFLRALPDHGNSRDLTAAQIGQTWLNYIIEGKSILWWGGLGYSTEHTAYLRLKHGMSAPESGSIATNGKTVAEQIGAQIFIDGWAMVAPGDPALAADLARGAASVSHDAEAVYAAQLWAAMEAAAFTESQINRLLDTGLSFIPADSLIRRLITDVREWHSAAGDWRQARAKLAAKYGYHKFPGVCHVVPNHGVMILSLLYGEDVFQKTLMIANTCGWDTDCNSGNVGCLMGIKNGLAGIDAGPDWRGPLVDRLYISSADGGRAITDAAIETYHIVNSGRALKNLLPIFPKSGARFHFDLPDAVQGFTVREGTAQLENVVGHSESGWRSLAIHYQAALEQPVRVASPTFIPPEAMNMRGYTLLACPTLYPGQTLRARVEADAANGKPITCTLFARVYGPQDTLYREAGPSSDLASGTGHIFEWRLPETNGSPIAEIGLELSAHSRANGTLYLDYLSWGGSPDMLLTRAEGTMWKRAWVEGISRLRETASAPFHVVQNEGTGLLIQGTRDWTNYQVSALVTPHLCKAAGIAARVQGMMRYYALLLGEKSKASLIKVLDTPAILAEKDFIWEYDCPYQMRLEVSENRVKAWIDDLVQFDVWDHTNPLESGGIALVIQEGCLSSGSILVTPS